MAAPISVSTSANDQLQQSSGGRNVSAFGAINFGDNSKLGGASAGMADSLPWWVYAVGAGLLLLLLFKR